MKVRFRFLMFFSLLIPVLFLNAAEAETSHVRRCRDKHIDPDTKTVLFQNCRVTDLEPFRSALEAYFDRAPVLRQLESSVELDLASVLPDFIVKNLGQRPPVESNCHNTAFYLAGAAPGPYSFEFNGNQSFPDHWVRLGIAERIKASRLSDLKTGDVLSFDNHSIFYLGEGLIVEFNPDQQRQHYFVGTIKRSLRFVSVGTNGLSTNYKRPFRILRFRKNPFDWNAMIVRELTDEPGLLDAYQKIRAYLDQKIRGEPATPPFSREQAKEFKAQYHERLLETGFSDPNAKNLDPNSYNDSQPVFYFLENLIEDYRNVLKREE